MQGRGTRSFAVPFAAAILAGVAGCTMCPDPHDYSGPVPNGSAPQNDFRVRSNGIIPTAATAMPWPTVVKAGAARLEAEPPHAAPVADAEPLVDDAEAGAGTGADIVRLSAADEPPEADVVGAGIDHDPAASDAVTSGGGVEGDAEPAVAATDSAPTTAPGTDEPGAEVEPSLRETPGWRPRR